MIQQGLLEQVESNLISQWVGGIGLQTARKGVPGRKEWLEEWTRGRKGSGWQSLNPKEGGTLWLELLSL